LLSAVVALAVRLAVPESAEQTAYFHPSLPQVEETAHIQAQDLPEETGVPAAAAEVLACRDRAGPGTRQVRLRVRETTAEAATAQALFAAAAAVEPALPERLLERFPGAERRMAVLEPRMQSAPAALIMPEEAAVVLRADLVQTVRED
jgi:hypothetical protein